MSSASGGTPEYVLVLTATVNPGQSVKVQRKDPEVRRRDYLSALDFWLQMKDSRLNRIVFLENSGADLSSFRELVSEKNPFHKSVEFISTEPVDIPEGIQHGWGELRMLDEGIAKSQLVSEGTHFIKATGRLIFPSLPRLLDRISGSPDVVAECRIPTSEFRRGLSLIPAILERRKAYATTQVILFRTSVYEAYFRGLHGRMEKWTLSGIMEYIIYMRLREVEQELNILWRFPVNCEPVGIGAKANQNYSSVPKRAVNFVRGLLRGTDIWL